MRDGGMGRMARLAVNLDGYMNKQRTHKTKQTAHACFSLSSRGLIYHRTEMAFARHPAKTDGVVVEHGRHGSADGAEIGGRSLAYSVVGRIQERNPHLACCVHLRVVDPECWLAGLRQSVTPLSPYCREEGARIALMVRWKRSAVRASGTEE